MNGNHGFPPSSGRNDPNSIPAVAGGGADTVPTSKGPVPFIHREPAIPPPVVLGDRPAGTIYYLQASDSIPVLFRIRGLGLSVVRTWALARAEREAAIMRRDLQNAREARDAHAQECRILGGHNRILTTANEELSREVAALRVRIKTIRDQVARHEEADLVRKEAAARDADPTKN